jgi:mannosyltransferase
VEKMIRRKDYVALVLILLAAFVVRVIDLDSSLQTDEITTVLLSIRISAEDLFLNSGYSFNNHLFYSLQAKASVFVFGESNWSIRLPAVIFGVASIAAMWRLAYMASGVLQAHITALLIAFSFHHVWFSQNARGYTELMFWFVFSTIILIRGLRNPSWTLWISYGLVIAAGVYTHLTALVFVAAQALIAAVIILRDQGRQGPWEQKSQLMLPLSGFLVGGLLTVLLYLPSIEVVFNQVMFHPSKSTSVMTERLNPVWTVVEILRSFGEITPLLLPSVIVALGLMAIGMVSLLRKQAIIPILFLLHIILMVTLLLALSMRIWPRFFLIDMGFVLFFITEGVFICSQYISRVLKHFTSWKISGNILFVSLSAVMLIISSGMLLKNYQFPKQDFEAAAKFLKAKQVGENINAIGPGAARFFTEYYGVDSRKIKSVDDLKLSEESSDNTWVVMTFPNQTARSHVAVMEHLEKNYFLAKTFRGTMGDGNVLIYRNNQVAE